MAIIKNIRQLKGATVLAERKSSTPSVDFKRFNLIYGFNGCGKSTLSRIFASLQQGARHQRLPEDCTFEIEMDDGAKYSCPKSLIGLEKRICVFNHDFVEANLRWAEGQASPIFTIGADQGDAAEQLKDCEGKLPAALALALSDAKILAEREKAFGEYKKTTAHEISGRLRQAQRYEATQFIADVKAAAREQDLLSDSDLDAATATCARSEAPAKVMPVDVPLAGLLACLEAAADLCPKSIGSVVVEGLDAHPTMVQWVKHGHDYHAEHNLNACLYCGNEVSGERRDLLASAFDDKVSSFIASVQEAAKVGAETSAQLDVAIAAVPAAAQLSAEFQPPFEAAAATLLRALAAGLSLLDTALQALQAREATPTMPVVVALPPLAEMQEQVRALEEACQAVNAICYQHASMVDSFNDHQKKARDAIRKHYVAQTDAAYKAHVAGIDEATTNAEEVKVAAEKLTAEIDGLRAKVQQHGPAADKINALVKSYLGHGELTIVAVAEGYELHRHGALVRGAPSEGEKTAIAICYFLSTLSSEDRKIKDLIVVIDDPVSSLDTKAMNYASALLLNRLAKAGQLFVFTHNQPCMNEFKKAWKGWARAEPDKPPTAKLLFIDVAVPEGTATRTATLVELPKQLREFDSEYHYLFQKVLEFEKAGVGHSDYAFMMPNVLRRVLEVFLAFKVPRSGNVSDKLKTIEDRYEGIDPDRLRALERLSQVESHSDNLDDLIAQSSMTVEESRDATLALIHLFGKVDANHLKDLRTHCKAAEPQKAAQPKTVAGPALGPAAEALPVPEAAPAPESAPETASGGSALEALLETGPAPEPDAA